MSKKIHAPLGTVEAKAKAFEAGIIFFKKVRIKDFFLEGNSSIIEQALKECSYAPSTVFQLIYGMLAECQEFRNVAFSYVKRQDNRPTHLLAKQALDLADFSARIDLIYDVSVTLSL